MDGPVYSIVDIETTGGHRLGNRIIEIAIIKWQNGKILDCFESLIYPERFVPVAISYFTGITNEMVEKAPRFYQVAKKIVEMTQGSIFVAHNVFFDFNFVKSEFAQLGYNFSLPKLCTVRLARQIFPGHKSYSLGKICDDLNIPIHHRHRAMGDAQATAQLFSILYGKNPALCQPQDPKKDHSSILLPPYVKEEEFQSLPEKPGIYYFWDKNGTLLYIGKSINIKKRVRSHFRINISDAKERELKGAISKITYEISGNDFCARLMECQQIKKLRPKYNRSMNRIRFRYHLVWQADIFGYLSPNLQSSNVADGSGAIPCVSKKAGNRKVNWIYKQAFGIDSDSLHFQNQLENMKSALNVSLYNQRLEQVLKTQRYPSENYKISCAGRKINETAFVVIENGRVTRIDFCQGDDTESFELSEDADMKNIVLAHHSSSLACGLQQ